MDQKDIEFRRTQCDACEHATNPGDIIFNYCSFCGCNINMITQNESSTCPADKWKTSLV
jgi:hypothetical protein